MKLSFFTVLAATLPAVHSFSSSDFPQDGDVPQSGYSTNHNLDPAKLSRYTVSWTKTFNTAEVFYAKPLVYTPTGASSERIFTVSNQNTVRVLDGLTGTLLASRQLDPPFQSSDTSCGDIPNTVGIIGTPIIDTATDLLYLWSKGYMGALAGAQGVEKGDWKLYALKVSDLTDAPGFPISVSGLNAYNDRARYIISGTLNQRPGLAMVGDSIVTAFGSHCDNFNFTGFLITASKTRATITDIQAMVAAPGAPAPQATNILAQNNGKSGIWMAGFGVAVDAPNNRVFFATGNGQGMGALGGDNGAVRSGKTYVSTLENAVASYSVDPTSGKLTQLDWWCPTNYDHLNGADRDIGSSGVALLDPTVFSGGGVNRIAVAAGKNGTIIVLDADNLGGYKNGPGQTDGVLQIISPPGASFFSGVASYPLEGGYIYFVPTGDHIYAYKFAIISGKPQFVWAGQTALTFGGKGAPRVTSLNGQAGTGVVWLSDVNQGLVAYHAVPDNNGVLQPYAVGATGRLTKFHRPSFGNGRVYTTENNIIIAVGDSGVAATTTSTTKAATSTTTSKTTTSSTTSQSTTSTTTSATTSATISVSTSKSTTSTTISATTSATTSKIITSATTSSSTSKPTTSTSSSVSSTTKSVSTPASVSASTTSTSTSSKTVTAQLSATPTDAFAYMGCYSDTSSGHALPLLVSNKSVTPELCEAYVSSLANKPTPTILNYYYVEYHQECYGGNSFAWQSSAVTSLTGKAVCTDVCSGSIGAATTGTAMCGGSKQFNLYARGGSSNLPQYWPGAAATTPLTASSSSTSTSTSLAKTASTITSSSSSSASKASSTSSTLTSTTSYAVYATPTPPSGQRVTLNWNLTWVNAAPDGTRRPMIGVNGQWPCPSINLNYGDTLVLNVYNGLGNESTSIHFHGLHQRNTTFSDGPTFATQCPVTPGSTFVYQFKADQIGTYWYHAHHAGQYIDGLRGPLIIANPAPPYGKVDQDLTLTLGDHYHEEAPYLINYYQSSANTDATGGTEPVPDSALMNEGQNTKIAIAAGKTYAIHVVNMGAVAGQYVQFDQHTMTIVEVDGQYVQPYEVSQLFVAVAQRYTVIVKAKADASQNFAIVATMLNTMFADSAQPTNPTVSGWLVYDATKALPTPFTLSPQPWNDATLVPLDQQALLDPADQTIYFAADFGSDGNGITRAFLNGNAYVNQKVPTLFTALTAPAEYLNNPSIYGTGANPYVLPYGAVIELQITNHDDRAHPFHLHGHVFQVVYRSGNGYLWPDLFATPTSPLKRDTLTVYGQGTATIRFRADNPGIQLFHCHTEWHVVGGMTATFVEAPTELVAAKPYIPGTHRDACDNAGIPRKGNAAGNSVNWLDLTGANTNTPVNNWGALTNPPS